MNDYGDNTITIEDEEGNEFELLILDEAYMGDVLYYALTDILDLEDEADAEVIILKVIKDEVSGEEILSTVDSDEELEAIYQIFEDRMFSEEDSEE